ncbi:MAG: HNH endonuclease [Prevotella sp.]|nr:HNH endonuclease [Prevotella sp.]
MEFVLNEYHRNTPDEELIADVKRVAEKLQKESLSCKDYTEHGKYSYPTVKNRFGSWNEVLRRAGLSVEKGRLKNHDYCESDEMLFKDMRRVAELLGRNYITGAEYDEYGKYNRGERAKKYGGWNGTLIAAGLEQTPFRTGPKRSYSDKELFDEMERIWIKLEHQPTVADFRSKGISMINAKPYLNRFGSWRKALEAFVAYINSDDDSDKDSPTESVETDEPITTNEEGTIIRHKTRRDINLRLRFRVMARDHFKCCTCGKSPATDPTVILHVDHIYPYSKGGETVMENLRTLCTKCNWGKSDLLIDNG